MQNITGLGVVVAVVDDGKYNYFAVCSLAMYVARIVALILVIANMQSMGDGVGWA